MQLKTICSKTSTSWSKRRTGLTPRTKFLLSFAVLPLMVFIISEACGGPYDKRYPGSHWGATGVAYGQTIPIPTLAPEPVIPIIGVGGCNDHTPYFCQSNQLFLPVIGKEDAMKRGGSGITPVTK